MFVHLTLANFLTILYADISTRERIKPFYLVFFLIQIYSR